MANHRVYFSFEYTIANIAKALGLTMNIQGQKLMFILWADRGHFHDCQDFGCARLCGAESIQYFD